MDMYVYHRFVLVVDWRADVVGETGKVFCFKEFGLGH